MANYYPDRWSNWFLQAIPKQNDMFQQGLIEIRTDQPITKSGEFFKKPIRTNITNVGDVERVTTTTTLTVNTVGDLKENVVVCHAGQAYGDVSLNDILRGIDSNNVFIQQYAKHWALQHQEYLISVTKGVFGALGTTHENDVTGTSDPYFSADNAIATQVLLGEVMNEYTAMVVHSYIFADMLKQSLVDYVDAGFWGESVLKTGELPSFMGKRIIVNDTLCAAVSSKYPVYFLTDKNWSFYWQKPLRIETDRNILLGGGQNQIAIYSDFAPHIDGLSFDVATYTNPTKAYLEDSDNWTQIDEDKNIKMVRMLVSKGV